MKITILELSELDKYLDHLNIYFEQSTLYNIKKVQLESAELFNNKPSKTVFTISDLNAFSPIKLKFIEKLFLKLKLSLYLAKKIDDDSFFSKMITFTDMLDTVRFRNIQILDDFYITKKYHTTIYYV